MLKNVKQFAKINHIKIRSQAAPFKGMKKLDSAFQTSGFN
jgi:hypothetical protein